MKTPMKAALLASITALILPLAACGGSSETTATSSSTNSSVAASSTAAMEKSANFPLTTYNCGGNITFDAPPQRVTLMNAASVTTLAELGVLDRVTTKAGAFPAEYFSADINKQLDAIPTLSDKLDPSGHLQISKEEVVATKPDLVIGFGTGVNRETMGDIAGIQIVHEPAFCKDLKGDATWDNVWEQILFYGKVFDKNKEAEAYVERLKKDVEKISEAGIGKGKTVAVLYPETGGGVFYAYGTGSMSNPVVTAAGLKNVYGDETTRVFETSAEELISRNPDIIIALHSKPEPEAAKKAILQIPGIERVTAVKNDAVVPMLLNYAEPPTPLSIQGVQKLDAYLRKNS
ncbi:ABC transporter substrate-binding protein [Corynebacterium caspium]|uniref:ABC transporter substrate-binding protein n=1 Tax=Corynebacterium caspium TaxID=234828 RepID=UPI0003601FC6|nr:ABC transporter substrate-binding protein [Corynebacterium caspium]WKD58739.1 corrinoid ABC transporter substrate-binding protein [Corynebacterium caspium DSM 44850]